jgi:hypothetical protein
MKLVADGTLDPDARSTPGCPTLPMLTVSPWGCSSTRRTVGTTTATSSDRT